MASGQSSESHTGKTEHKKRRVDTPDRNYHSSGETHAGRRIPVLQDYQRRQHPSTHTTSSNYESGNDLFNARQTDFQQQSTYVVSSDPMGTGSRAASQQDYHRQHYPANQSVPSNYERRSGSFETQRGNLPLQITQVYSRNPIRSGVQAGPDYSRQVETQTIPSHYESLGNSSNTWQSGQIPREISSDQSGMRIQAGQDYQIQHYPANQSLAPTYGSQSDLFITHRSYLPPQITEVSGDSSGREIPAWQDYQRQQYPAAHRHPYNYESQTDPFNTRVQQSYLPQQIIQGFSSDPTGRVIHAEQYYQGQHYQATQGLQSRYGSEISSLNPETNDPQITQAVSSHPTRGGTHALQDQRQRYAATQEFPSYHESQNAPYSAQQYNIPPQSTQGVLSNQLGREIEAGQDYQRQYNPASQRIPSNHEGVSSDQIESDGEDSRNNFEQIPTDERLSDSFTKKLYDLAQEITDVIVFIK
ncbi:uncharacterized protein [Ptychodera flava]|uniref:uncharacterized protein n=1 Tax=Ptychodera flava TaxID=63121 RepID=UPI00396A4AF0